MKVNKNIEKIKPYNIELLPKNIKRMHANESDKPILPNKILMKDVNENLNFYPENKAKKLIKEASIFYKIEEKNITTTNGSDEGLDLIIKTFCNPKDTILVLEPGFSMYEQYAKVFGVKVEKIELQELQQSFIFDEKKIIEKAKKIKAKIVFIPNPLANIGEIIDRKKLIKIIENLPETIIVIDEAYIDFTNEKSLLYELNNYRNLIVLRTFSKFFGLAGIRLGFIFSNFTDEILKIKSPYNVNILTCQIGINVFKNITESIVKQRQNEILQKRNKLKKWLENFKEVKKIFNSKTNFLLVKLSCKSEIFAKKLEKEFDIKIKAMSGKFKNYCRISVL